MRCLYLGLEPPSSSPEKEIVHYPVIRIEVLPFDAELKKQIPSFTHYLFTSKTAVRLFFDRILPRSIRTQHILAVGKATANTIRACGLEPTIVCVQETAEGLVEELKKMDLSQAHLFWPHSQQARGVLSDYLKERQARFTEVALYQTLANHPGYLPDLDDFDEIFFTSPSTVDSFVGLFGYIPKNKKLLCQGPITNERLQNFC